jgi:hypothetical protein
MEKSIVVLILIGWVLIGYYVGMETGEKKYLGEPRNVYTLPEHTIYHVLWCSENRYDALVKDPHGKIIFVTSAGAKFPFYPSMITIVSKKMFAVRTDKNNKSIKIPFG